LTSINIAQVAPPQFGRKQVYEGIQFTPGNKQEPNSTERPSSIPLLFCAAAQGGIAFESQQIRGVTI